MAAFSRFSQMVSGHTGFLFAAFAFLGLSNCAPIPQRAPVPPQFIETSKPYGVSGPIRRWANTPEDFSEQDRVSSRLWKRPGPHATLALSGGGQHGAYGAGLLKGWSARGDRPEFEVVTGISTGAVIAVFAFLGSDYDAALEDIYTSYSTGQLLRRNRLGALFGAPALNTAQGYEALIRRYIDDKVVDRLAQKARQGRRLIIGTTNLDATRSVHWDVTAIAASGSPNAKLLIQKVIQASSALPGVFPPVLMPVDAPDGRTYDEMHVDGGATQQVTIIGPHARHLTSGRKADATLYMIINEVAHPPYAPVKPRISKISETALTSLVNASLDADSMAIFHSAEQSGLTLRATAIPPDFGAQPKELFDKSYMKRLFQLGYQTGLSGREWTLKPADLLPPS